ncbi:hypothetical protein GA0061098_105716 [Bradyrhizobium shewense]|uniref:Uncharacterized protein n=1 Tax=Bradyrhizobium shewense TaxID=1761772 RepID=A0A1C3XUB2_9BRAD|nr:hypothetical protein GA0061098_105716 [Bradyrhizobium shewense]
MQECHGEPLADYGCRIVTARNEPIDREQAGFDDGEREYASDPSEEDDGKSCEHDPAEDIGHTLATRSPLFCLDVKYGIGLPSGLPAGT